jgi:hypothetical protein
VKYQFVAKFNGEATVYVIDYSNDLTEATRWLGYYKAHLQAGWRIKLKRRVGPKTYESMEF